MTNIAVAGALFLLVLLWELFGDSLRDMIPGLQRNRFTIFWINRLVSLVLITIAIVLMLNR